MLPNSDTLAALCAAHAPVNSAGHFPSGTIFGDWRLTAFIGRGGNGEVYCAEHTTLGTPAAVKVLMRDDARAKARFAREAQLLARLRSDAFPRFFAYGEANGHPYLAMELLEPGDLPTGDRSVARFLLKVCDAVAELHAQGFVHRDIKPGNILWRSVGARVPRVRQPPNPVGSRVPRDRGRASLPSIPVLADLGLVKDVTTSDAGRPSSDVTLGGVGTPGYGAPEQMERGEATIASDIHALGVLADRCFNGNPPRAWARIIQRATSSIPAHRYPSVAALARAIRRRNLMRTMVFAFAVASLVLAIAIGRIMLMAPASRHPVSASALRKTPNSAIPLEQDCWEELRDETWKFYKRAMLLKAKIDGEVLKGNGGIGREEFKALVEKERNDLLQQWESAKALQDAKILAWKKQTENSTVLAKNPVAKSVAMSLPEDFRAWREKVDRLLRSTLYFACMQL